MTNVSTVLSKEARNKTPCVLAIPCRLTGMLWPGNVIFMARSSKCLGEMYPPCEVMAIVISQKASVAVAEMPRTGKTSWMLLLTVLFTATASPEAKTSVNSVPSVSMAYCFLS